MTDRYHRYHGWRLVASVSILVTKRCIWMPDRLARYQNRGADKAMKHNPKVNTALICSSIIFFVSLFLLGLQRAFLDEVLGWLTRGTYLIVLRRWWIADPILPHCSVPKIINERRFILKTV